MRVKVMNLGKAAVAALSVVSLWGCALDNMVKVDKCPDVRGVTPLPGKAVLVIAATLSEENYDLEDNPDIDN